MNGRHHESPRHAVCSLSLSQVCVFSSVNHLTESFIKEIGHPSYFFEVHRRLGLRGFSFFHIFSTKPFILFVFPSPYVLHVVLISYSLIMLVYCSHYYVFYSPLVTVCATVVLYHLSISFCGTVSPVDILLWYCITYRYPSMYCITCRYLSVVLYHLPIPFYVLYHLSISFCGTVSPIDILLWYCITYRYPSMVLYHLPISFYGTVSPTDIFLWYCITCRYPSSRPTMCSLRVSCLFLCFL
jgi:hypothetical protein